MVIAIIGILAALATVSYSDSQKKSRDSRRKSDMEAIRKALELAKADTAGGYNYPMCSSYNAANQYPPFSALGPTVCYINNISTALAPTYIAKLPTDPRSSSTTTYNYAYQSLDSTGAACASTSTCTAFKLTTCLENRVDPQRDIPSLGAICPNSTNTLSYTISNF